MAIGETAPSAVWDAAVNLHSGANEMSTSLVAKVDRLVVRLDEVVAELAGMPDSVAGTRWESDRIDTLVELHVEAELLARLCDRLGLDFVAIAERHRSPAGA